MSNLGDTERKLDLSLDQLIGEAAAASQPVPPSRGRPRPPRANNNHVNNNVHQSSFQQPQYQQQAQFRDHTFQPRNVSQFAPLGEPAGFGPMRSVPLAGGVAAVAPYNYQQNNSTPPQVHHHVARPTSGMPAGAVQNNFGIRSKWRGAGGTNEHRRNYPGTGGMRGHSGNTNWAPKLSVEERTQLCRDSALVDVKTSSSPDGDYVVQLKGTNVVVIKKATGEMILDSGGWRTLTTRIVINECLKPIGLELIAREDQSWQVGNSKNSLEAFEDKMSLKRGHPAQLLARISVVSQYLQQARKAAEIRLGSTAPAEPAQPAVVNSNVHVTVMAPVLAASPQVGKAAGPRSQHVTLPPPPPPPNGGAWEEVR